MEKSDRKLGKRYEDTFYPTGFTDGSQAHENMFNIISH